MALRYLKTKLQAPFAEEAGLVFRGRLKERLDRGLSGKVILVSAPAGFGKTTLLAGWVRRQNIPACWLSIDETDNDPQRFMGYFVAALQTIQAKTGTELLQSLEAPEPPEIDGLMVSLLNEVAASDEAFLFVLDDLPLCRTGGMAGGRAGSRLPLDCRQRLPPAGRG